MVEISNELKLGTTWITHHDLDLYNTVIQKTQHNINRYKSDTGTYTTSVAVHSSVTP